MPHTRPPEPSSTIASSPSIWYRNWEVSFDHEAFYWTRSGWRAYRGGCDLDARELSSETYTDLLDQIDDEED